jgi:hypothetical protein
MGKYKITPQDFTAIRWHNQELIDACVREIDKLQSIPRANRPEWLKANLQWWRHCKAALEWSTEIANQRLGGSPNVNRSTVQ